MFLYEQHQSEDNSHFDGCPLQIPCTTDAEVFITMLGGGRGALFITVFRPQTHSSAYHCIPSEKHAGWLAPSVNQAHPFSSDITYINDFYRFMLSPDSKTSQHIRIFSFTCYTLYTKVLYDGIYAASNSVFWYLQQAQAKTKKYNMRLAINYIWTSGS